MVNADLHPIALYFTSCTSFQTVRCKRVPVKSSWGVGIELDEPVGRHNGTIQGTRYFQAEVNRGAVVPPIGLHLLAAKPRTRRDAPPKDVLDDSSAFVRAGRYTPRAGYVSTAEEQRAAQREQLARQQRVAQQAEAQAHAAAANAGRQAGGVTQRSTLASSVADSATGPSTLSANPPPPPPPHSPPSTQQPEHELGAAEQPVVPTATPLASKMPPAPAPVAGQTAGVHPPVNSQAGVPSPAADSTSPGQAKSPARTQPAASGLDMLAGGFPAEQDECPSPEHPDRSPAAATTAAAVPANPVAERVQAELAEPASPRVPVSPSLAGAARQQQRGRASPSTPARARSASPLSSPNRLASPGSPGGISAKPTAMVLDIMSMLQRIESATQSAARAMSPPRRRAKHAQQQRQPRSASSPPARETRTAELHSSQIIVSPSHSLSTSTMSSRSQALSVAQLQMLQASRRLTESRRKVLSLHTDSDVVQVSLLPSGELSVAMRSPPSSPRSRKFAQPGSPGLPSALLALAADDGDTVAEALSAALGPGSRGHVHDWPVLHTPLGRDSLKAREQATRELVRTSLASSPVASSAPSTPVGAHASASAGTLAPGVISPDEEEEEMQLLGSPPRSAPSSPVVLAVSMPSSSSPDSKRPGLGVARVEAGESLPPLPESAGTLPSAPTPAEVVRDDTPTVTPTPPRQPDRAVGDLQALLDELREGSTSRTLPRTSPLGSTMQSPSLSLTGQSSRDRQSSLVSLPSITTASAITMRTDSDEAPLDRSLASGLPALSESEPDVLGAEQEHAPPAAPHAEDHTGLDDGDSVATPAPALRQDSECASLRYDGSPADEQDIVRTGSVSSADGSQPDAIEGSTASIELAAGQLGGVVVAYAGVCEQGSEPDYPAKPNQDRVLVYEQENSGAVLVLIADGHGPEGHVVSQFVIDQLPVLLADDDDVQAALAVLKSAASLAEPDWSSGATLEAVAAGAPPSTQPTAFMTQAMPAEPAGSAMQQLFAALRRIILQLDVLLQATEDIDAQLSGCTLCVSIIIGSWLATANVGDSRASLLWAAPEGHFHAVRLTQDHKPSLRSETRRIMLAGGFLSSQTYDDGMEGPVRVWQNSAMELPGLALSRALGDFVGKTCGVSAEPTCGWCWLPVMPAALVAGSDGLWEYLSEADVASTWANIVAGNGGVQSMTHMEGAAVLLQAAVDDLLCLSAERWVAQENAIDDTSLAIVLTAAQKTADAAQASL